MTVDVIEMDAAKAQAHLREYRAANKERRTEGVVVDAEYQAIARGLRVLSRGGRLINVVDAICKGGVDQLYRPRLAWARADCQWVWCKVSHYQGTAFDCKDGDFWGRRHWSLRLRLPTDGLSRPSDTNETYQAAVPLIPPAIRPEPKLQNYHILWEAEWERVPPRDPLLVRRVHGALYQILAAWDLTPLEREVMRGRFGT